MERQKKKEVLKQKRETLHLPRRSYHFLMGLICFSIYQWMVDRQGALMLIFGIGGPFALLDFLRLRIPKLNTAALKLFGSIMRREELLRITANTWYIFSLAILVLFFPKPIALLSILYLAAGDPIAAVIGTRWGRHPLLAGKSWEGTTANFIVRGRLVRFDTDDHQTDPRGLVAFNGLKATLAENGETEFGKATIS